MTAMSPLVKVLVTVAVLLAVLGVLGVVASLGSSKASRDQGSDPHRDRPDGW